MGVLWDRFGGEHRPLTCTQFRTGLARDLILKGGGVFVTLRYGLIFCVSFYASIGAVLGISLNFKNYLPAVGVSLKTKDVSLEAILAMAGAFVVTMLLLLIVDAFLQNRDRFRRERHCREEGEARQAWLSAALLDVDGECSARLAKLRQGPEAIGENIDGISDVPFMIVSGAKIPLVAYWKAVDEEGVLAESVLAEAVKTLNAVGTVDWPNKHQHPRVAFLEMLCNTPLGPDTPPPKLNVLIHLEWGAFDRGLQLASKTLIHFGERAPAALVRGIGH